MNLPSRLQGTVALSLLFSGCDSKSSTKPANASSNSPLTAPIDYIAAQGRAKQHATKVISTAQIETAIQQFQAMEDRFPASLDELVAQHYLQAVPVAPRGKTFVYNPQSGQLRVINE